MAYATLYILVTVAVLTVANILANRYNKTYDTTSNKKYTLSEQTVKNRQGFERTCNDLFLRPAVRIQEQRRIRWTSTRISLPKSMFSM